MPRKPTSPATHWVFPKHSAPYLVSDQLPSDSEELEAMIVAAFATRLRGLGHTVEERPRPSEWPDASLLIDGDVVGTELVEVVDIQHRQQVAGQRWYIDELRHGFETTVVGPALYGMALELSDGYRGVPPARSRAARHLVAAIVEQMAAYRETFASSEVNIWRSVYFHVEPWQVQMFGQRLVDDANDYKLQWNGAYAVDPLCLARTIERKIEQRYTGRGSFDQLWLLAWDSFGYLLSSDKDVALDLLEKHEHNFDEVWTCYLAGADAVFVEQLWSKRPNVHQ